MPASAASHEATESLLTEPGLLVGTADYMAPEQVRGQDVDARADVWALGVVLYEMIAGRRPFLGDTKADVQAQVLQGEPAPLTRADASVPPEVQRIVDRALHKDPSRRYQVMKDLLLDLEALRDAASLRQRSSGASTTARTTTPRSAWRAGLPWGLGRSSPSWRSPSDFARASSPSSPPPSRSE